MSRRSKSRTYYTGNGLDSYEIRNDESPLLFDILKETDCLYRKGFFKDAKIQVKKLLDKSPDNTDGRLLYCIILHHLDQYDDSIDQSKKEVEIRFDKLNRSSYFEDFKKIIGNNIHVRTNNSKAYFVKGVLLGKLKKYDEAIVALDIAILVEPDYAEALFKKGICFDRLERYDEAIAVFDQVTKLDPKCTQVWISKGILHGKLRQYSQAIEAFDNAIESRLIKKSGMKNVDVIIKIANQAIKEDENNIDAYLVKGFFCGHHGRYFEGKAIFDKAIALNPSDVKSWRRKGIFLATVKKYEEAIEIFNHVLEIDPDNAEVWLRQSQMFKHIGWVEDSLEIFDVAVKINPEYSEYRELLFG